MKRVKIVSLPVKDYDAAIDFYTNKIGFHLVEDIPYGDRRWVTLALRGDGCTLALELATKPEDQDLVGRQGGSFPLLALDTHDCHGDYKTLRARGVAFQGEPESDPWGTGVLFEDLYGNKIFLNQEA